MLDEFFPLREERERKGKEIGMGIELALGSDGGGGTVLFEMFSVDFGVWKAVCHFGGGYGEWGS